MEKVRAFKNDAEDLEIIDLYWKRDEEAISKTKAKYGGYLKSISSKILRIEEDVEEALSDTYVGAWNGIPPAKPNVLRGYLGKIARNLSLKKYRSINAEKRGGGEAEVTLEELSDVISDGTRIDEHLETEELAGYISEFLESRNERDRKVFMRRYWYFDSVSDIAKQYELTESNVKMILKRSRDELRAYLAEKEIYV